jgi:hypothetical protein
VLALIVMSALAALSTSTVFSVRNGVQTSAGDRFHNIAVYAAESGGAVAMDYLRQNIDPTYGWKAFITPSNINPYAATAAPLSSIPGNGILPGQTGNLFDADMNAYYAVQVYNDRADTGFVLGGDDDKRVIIHVTGYGPNGATAVIEWDIKSNSTATQRPCPSYAQKGESEDNSGRNDCLGTINTGDTATF